MRDAQREFLDALLTTPSPSGYETAGQRVWLDYVSTFADEVRTDAYGNAVAVHEGGDPEFALAGHGDEIGLIVRRIDGDGFVRIGPIGGADRTVSKGQHVTIHADEPVPGVVGGSQHTPSIQSATFEGAVPRSVRVAFDTRNRNVTFPIASSGTE